MLLSACWVLLVTRLVSCVAPPLCQPDTRCSLSSPLHSPVGEYLYTVAGVSVEVDVYGEHFSIVLGGHSIDPAHLPRYKTLQYYRELHLLGVGRGARAGSLLSALNLNTTRLELRHWQGDALGDDLAAALPGLASLELSGLPENSTVTELRWGKLAALRELSATDAVLVGPPPFQLNVMRAMRCRLSALPASLRKLQALRSQLPRLPDGLLSLHVSDLAPPSDPLPRSLVNLTLERLAPSSLPTSLPSTMNSLLVSRCSLVSIPPEWTSLPQLRRLRVSHNLLPVSPTRDAHLPALLELDLSYNKLTSLRRGDLPLSSLTDLQLDHNLLQTLSSEVFAECPNLQRLRVTNNRLTELGSGGMPSGLLLVDARNNLFTELTERELAGRPGLVLDYGGSPVTMLKGGVGDWAELRLRNARLHCGAALLDWIERAGPMLSRVSAVCTSPPALVGRSLQEAPRDMYQDHVPDGCPSGCTCVLHARGPILLLTCNVTLAFSLLANYRVPPALRTTSFELVLEGNISSAVGLPEGIARLELRGPELTGLPPLPSGLRQMDVRGARAARGAEPAGGLSKVQVLLSCDCDTLRFVEGAGELRCGGGEDVDMVRERCAREEIGEVDRTLLSGWTAGAVVVVSVVMGAACWVVARYYRRPSDPAPAGDLQYDAFVSFAHEDRAWVCRVLVPRLEQSGARLCLHSRDWLPGGFVPALIDRSVRSARVTLLVASPHFARSPWAGAELMAALQGGRGALLLLLPDAPLAALLRDHPSLARRTHLHSEDPHFWCKLQRAVLPPDPATPAALSRLLCCPTRTPLITDDVSYKKSHHAVA